MKTDEKVRIEARIDKRKKELFKNASDIGGYNTLTDFIIFSAEKEANNILEKHNKILSSERDKQVFFDALLTEAAPNKALKDAANEYKKIFNEKFN